LRAAKDAGLHTVIDTSGYGDGEQFEKIAEYADLFLWDIKDTDTVRHKQNTGVSVEPILENLRRVDCLGAKTILRCLIISGVNSEKAHLDSIVEIYRGLKHCQKVELVKYHIMGCSKYQMLGMAMESNNQLIPTKETMLQAQEYLFARGINTVSLAS
jgi:pyruvate formate lyase activating enzyme